MTPVTDVQESGVNDISGPEALIDTKALDAAQRHETHPFAIYCGQVREACEIPDTQAAREVVSAICGDVARLDMLDDVDLDEQAEHIGKMVAKDREERGDRQLWAGAATRIAKRALELRQEGKGVIADPAAK